MHRRDAGGRDDRVAEGTALLVLAHLELQPEQTVEHPQRGGPVPAASVERRAQLRQRRDDLLRRGVGATTREFTSRVVAGFQLSNRNAEFWAGPMRMGVVRR